MNIARRPMSARQQRSLLRPWWSLWTSWRLIAASALVCGGVALLVALLFERPLYRASFTVTVTLATTVNSTNNPALKTMLVPSYARLVTTRPILAAVAAKHPGMTADMLAQEVSVSTAASASTFRISVLDPDATRASHLAYDVATETAAQTQRVIELQYDVEEQQVQQDLQNTNTQIASDEATLATDSKPADPQRKAVIQSQLDSLRQRLAGDLSVLSQIKVARDKTPRALKVDIFGQLEEPHSSTPFTIGGIATLGGASIGVVLVLALALLRQRIRGSQDVELLLGWPVLAVMPLSEGAIDEAPSALRLSEETTRVVPRTLFVTSVRSPSRADIVARNLALGLADSGSNTLLVDTDLRRTLSSRSLSWMGVPAEPGLSDALLVAAGRRTTTPTSLTDTIHALAPSASTARAVRVMPAGTPAPNPLGLLRSAAMASVYQQLLAYGADRVVFSGRSLLDSAEAPFLAGRLDAVVLVVDPRRLHRADLLRAANVLRASPARVLGCIFVGNTPSSQRTARAYADKGGRSS